jgi:prevent-host-death family protein
MDRGDINIPSKSLRDHVSEVVDAARGGRRFIVTRNGRPRAAIVSLDDLAILQAAEDAADRRVAAERKREPLVDWEDLKEQLGLKPTPARARPARKALRRRSA